MTKAAPIPPAMPEPAARIGDLFGQLQQVRLELAELYRPADGDAHAFDKINCRLSGILETTELSCQAILTALEGIMRQTEEIRREAPGSSVIAAACDSIEGHGATAMESCAFHDLTSQRVTKIARAVARIEGQVTSITEIFGQDDIQGLADRTGAQAPVNGAAAEPAMEGPQLSNAALSQDDIDTLFD